MHAPLARFDPYLHGLGTNIITRICQRGDYYHTRRGYWHWCSRDEEFPDTSSCRRDELISFDGSLTTVLDAFRPAPVPVHVVHPEGRIASAKVRALVDFMVENLRRNEILQVAGY